MRELSGLSNIVLIGFMGTGKTSIGRRVAQILALNFVDSDAEIEAVMDMSVSDIFAKYGEVRFRSEENLIIQKLSRLKRTVIATGGGAVLNPANLGALQACGIVITLSASAEVIDQRTARKGSRPLLKNSLASINEMMAMREYAYRQGDYSIDTTALTVEEVVDELVQLLEEIGYDKGQG